MHVRQLLALSVVLGIAASACGGSVDAAISPAATTGAEAPAAGASQTDDGTDRPAPAATSAPDAGAASAEDPAATTAFHVEPEGSELALVLDDRVEVIATLDPEGESVFRAAAVRPGSTSTDMTVVVVTSAEGMYDLRWLEVRDGEAGKLTVFPEAHRMRTDLASLQDLVPVVVWSPDGASIAWLEPGDDGAVLRTVGWSDGPGTDRPADDNAAFGLEGAPSVLQARSWEVSGADGSQTTIRAEDVDGAAFQIHVERQGDGALAVRQTTRG